MPATNEVVVTFKADAANFFRTTDAVAAKVRQVANVQFDNAFAAQAAQSVAAPIKKAGDDIQKLSADAIRQAVTLRETLRDTALAASAGHSPIWQTYGTGARQAAQQTRLLYGELKQLQIEASRTTDAKALANIERQAQAASSEIERLTAKMNRVHLGRTAAAGDNVGGLLGLLGGRNNAERYGRLNIARQGADVFTTAAMGMSPAMILIQQGPQVLDAMATSGITLSKSMVVSAGAVGGLAAAGYIFVQWSKSVREEAEKRLKTEEMIAGAIAMQVKGAKEGISSAAAMRENAADARKFSESLGTKSADQLRRDIATRQRIIELGGYFDDPKNPERRRRYNELVNEQIRLEEQLAAVEKYNGETSSRNFESSYQWRKKVADEAAAAEKARAEAFKKSVEEGTQKVKELQGVYRETFVTLAAQANDSNPFVKVFFDADKALGELKKNIAGLPQDMQAAAINSQRQFNARQLFGARVDTALASFDLRELATRFRDRTEMRRSLAAGNLSAQEQEFQRLLGLGANVNVQANLDYFERTKRINNSLYGGDNAASRFDRQMRAFDNINPANAAERSLLDQRILRTAGSYDPNELRMDQRDRIATIAEREADRTARLEQEAFRIQTEQLEISKRLLEVESKQLELVQKGGKQSLELLIKDETKAGLAAQKNPARPTGRDTDQLHVDVLRLQNGL